MRLQPYLVCIVCPELPSGMVVIVGHFPVVVPINFLEKPVEFVDGLFDFQDSLVVLLGDRDSLIEKLIAEFNVFLLLLQLNLFLNLLQLDGVYIGGIL